VTGVRDPLEAVLGAALWCPSSREAEVLAVRVGAFWTAVRTTAGAGLASTLRGEAHLTGETPVAWAGSLAGRSPSELLGLLRSPSLLEASVGLATANALLGEAAGRITEENAVEIIARRGRGRRVVMVGRFPFTPRLDGAVGELVVHDRGSRGGGGGGDELLRDLGSADVVALTATTLLNGTLPEILERVPQDAFLMMLGPSTPMAAPLLELGFDVLCGTVVEDPAAVVRTVGEGAVTGQITGVRRVCLWGETGASETGAGDAIE